VFFLEFNIIKKIKLSEVKFKTKHFANVIKRSSYIFNMLQYTLLNSQTVQLQMCFLVHRTDKLICLKKIQSTIRHTCNYRENCVKKNMSM